MSQPESQTPMPRVPGSNEERTVRSLFDLGGRVALVTGGTGHLGSAMCRALAEAGARVVLASRDQTRAEEAAARLPGTEPHLGWAVDHMVPESLEESWGRLKDRVGSIDILINNGHEGLGVDWTTVTAEQFNRQLANATGYFLLARLCRDLAVEQARPTSIVLIGSMYGVVGSYPEAYEGISIANPVAYQTLKGGVVQMARHLAVYWAKDRVRVNCLSPGPFPGPGADPKLVERLAQKSPMRRMGRPEELKGAVLFLASDASSYVTGQNLLVDGGWTAW